MLCCAVLQIWCGTEPNRDAFPLVVYDPNNFEKRHTFSELRDEWVNVILATSNKVGDKCVCVCCVCAGCCRALTPPSWMCVDLVWNKEWEDTHC